jgi:hypothetical protein
MKANLFDAKPAKEFVAEVARFPARAPGAPPVIVANPATVARSQRLFPAIAMHLVMALCSLGAAGPRSEFWNA